MKKNERKWKEMKQQKRKKRNRKRKKENERNKKKEKKRMKKKRNGHFGSTAILTYSKVISQVNQLKVRYKAPHSIVKQLISKIRPSPIILSLMKSKEKQIKIKNEEKKDDKKEREKKNE